VSNSAKQSLALELKVVERPYQEKLKKTEIILKLNIDTNILLQKLKNPIEKPIEEFIRNHKLKYAMLQN